MADEGNKHSGSEPATTETVVFYSWQRDLPNSTNRGLIESALEKVAKKLASTLDIAPRVDSDTQGSSGAPDIAETIFQKIDTADVFVADISIIGRTPAGRPTPNPNVLVELGYAIRSMGWERVLLVCNTAFGTPEELPFDLRGRRVLTYESKKDDASRADPRLVLESRLHGAVLSALDSTRRSKAKASPHEMAEEALRISQETLHMSTGGDEYCSAKASMPSSDGQISIFLSRDGKYPSHDVVVSIDNCTARADWIRSQEAQGKSIHSLPVGPGDQFVSSVPLGTLPIGGSFARIATVKIPTGAVKQDFTMTVGARNGSVFSVYRYRLVAEKWLRHVTSTLNRNGKSTRILEKVDDGFPVGE